MVEEVSKTIEDAVWSADGTDTVAELVRTEDSTINGVLLELKPRVRDEADDSARLMSEVDGENDDDTEPRPVCVADEDCVDDSMIGGVCTCTVPGTVPVGNATVMVIGAVIGEVPV